MGVAVGLSAVFLITTLAGITGLAAGDPGGHGRDGAGDVECFVPPALALRCAGGPLKVEPDQAILLGVLSFMKISF